MTITAKEIKETHIEEVTQVKVDFGDGIEWFIGINSTETDLQQKYQDWLAEGNTPEPADE